MRGGRCFFSPSYLPPIVPCEFSFTIHDLNHLDVPQNAGGLKTLYYLTVLRSGIRRASSVLTVSEYSRKRIIEWSGCAPEKVHVVGNGVSEAFTPIGPDLEPSPGNGRSYIFSCTNRKGHKNEVRLLKAFALSGLRSDFDLVLPGVPSGELHHIIDKLGISEQVRFTGQMNDSQLAQTYRAAVFTIFPSMYEGFGIPIVESMACGVPVLSSSATSLPEVGGDAAIYFDPSCVEAMAGGMTRLASDKELRTELRRKGLERAKLFTWERTAVAAFAALQPLIDSRSRMR